MTKLTTKQWAESFGIATLPKLPPVPSFQGPCPFTAREIATRAIVVHGVIAAACGVVPQPIVEWFKEQRIWHAASPKEQALLLNANLYPNDVIKIRWQQEAEWALLWVVEKVDVLGLPTCQCDTRRLVDEIIPKLGSDLEPFLVSAALRMPGELLAETDRHYDLWCRYFQTRREHPELLPWDLNVQVLYQREYAFEWLQGIEPWDDVQCDA